MLRTAAVSAMNTKHASMKWSSSVAKPTGGVKVDTTILKAADVRIMDSVIDMRSDSSAVVGTAKDVKLSMTKSQKGNAMLSK